MRRPALVSVLPLVFACADADPGMHDGGGLTGIDPGTTSDGGSDGDSGGGSGDTSDPEPDPDGPGPKFDVGDGMGTGDPDGGEDGCTKIDFLFVIDNSGSMFDNQQNLVANYPGFMEAITGTLEVDDFQVMVVDTDTLTTCADQCAYWLEAEPCPWLDNPCDTTVDQAEARTACDEVLGAGVVNPMGTNSSGQVCEFLGGNRFITPEEPDLVNAFGCAARVGTAGDAGERQMDALLAAISPDLNGAGGCNEGFLREDAVLVVTVLTDETSHAPVQFDIEAWRAPLVAAKGGNEEAVVMLGLVPDGNILGGGVCDGTNHDYASKMIDLVDSLPHGSWASVCETDYRPFFEAAVGVVDTACDGFVPPG